VLLGADNLCRAAPIEGRRVLVKSVELDERFIAASNRFDLAALTLSDALPSQSARQVSLHHDVVDSVALGWGAAAAGAAPSCVLMATRLRILPDDECAVRVEPAGRQMFDPASMLCAVPSSAGGTDTCAGDSGGPLFEGTDYSTASVVGIVSWGRGCGGPWAGVYARASAWGTRDGPNLRGSTGTGH
jgi:secreted trypsin-like serine protease